MITHLHIQNLILVEKADISFGPGLNIITGETGSGKSAILTAIRLILGERADLNYIRSGTDLAIIEAAVGKQIVRRELHRSGRSRCFIDDELVTLQELRALPIELVDQSASVQEREFLDTFGKIDSHIHYTEWMEAQKHLEQLLKTDRNDLNLIQQVNWKKEEEETLQAEHHMLTHAAELLEKMGSISSVEIPKRILSQVEQLIRIDPKFQECADYFQTAFLNLEEASRFLHSYASKLEPDPERLFAVEKRLSEIESLKRRFGSFERVEEIRVRLCGLDAAIEQAKNNVTELHIKVQTLSTALTQNRKKAAAAFAKAILSVLKELNLPDTQFSIEVLPKSLSENGADEIRYLFSANPGQSPLPLDRCASGGELSRLLFAMKVVLGSQNTCLIFDEIDSNVGGQTATLLGAKLQTLAQKHQLICVTHFVQVAKCATDHFLVSKHGATTHIKKLESHERAKEFARMTGV